MENSTLRKPASFRLNADLLEILKERANACNRSLNNYVESLLLSAISGDEPNEITKSAIEEAKQQAKAIREGKQLDSVDTSSVQAMLSSLGL